MQWLVRRKVAFRIALGLGVFTLVLSLVFFVEHHRMAVQLDNKSTGNAVTQHLGSFVSSRNNGRTNSIRQSSNSNQNREQVQSEPDETTNDSSRATDVPEDFITDTLCGGCRHAVTDEEGHRCGYYIHRWMREDASLTLEQAGRRAAHEFPVACQACDVSSCAESSDKRYWRYDRAAPSLLATEHQASARTYQLSSIPSVHRLPSHALQGNLTAYLLSLGNQPASAGSEEDYGYLFEYNPSIVQIPDSQRLEINGEMPVYLASFRVSNQHYCFPKHVHQLMDQHGGGDRKNVDWLGLALLREDLTILSDTVVDVKPVKLRGAQDFRPIVLNDDDQLYVSSNDMISPLWLIPPTHTYTQHHQDFVDTSLLQALPIVFGNWTVTVREFPSCAACDKKRGFCGKNVNFFMDNASNQARVEIWPSAPHLVRHLDLQAPCRRGLNATNFVDDSSPPLATFSTVEELYYPNLTPLESILTRGRGGACCIPLTVPANASSTTLTPGSTVMAGILHVKTPHQRHFGFKVPTDGKASLSKEDMEDHLGGVEPNHYLSRLYAFDARPPYKLVATSGLFCLGFPDTPDEHDPLAQATTWRKLKLHTTFDCPRIHFVSGLTLKANDPNTAIFTYGINDCVSRMVQVPVSELQRLLFG